MTKVIKLPKTPLDPFDPKNSSFLKNLQGNILQGHGRDFSTNIFIQFLVEGEQLRKLIKDITVEYVTSAGKQAEESMYFKRFNLPGSLFGSLLLTASAYRKLGFDSKLQEWFTDKDENFPSPPAAFPESNSFIKGMRAVAHDFGDIPSDLDQVPKDRIRELSPIQQYSLFKKKILKEKPALDPLEAAYLNIDGIHIDALLLLADDNEGFLLRETRALITRLESMSVIKVLAVELGKALRNEDNEGIEHFGYVDGRSQPLFLTTDFKTDRNGNTIEKVNEKARMRESGNIDVWNPLAKLDLVVKKDPGVDDTDAYGSYFVFRKLEQDVLRFSMAEQVLADKLQLVGDDRKRAGAMMIGRFRDGSPLALSQTDGFVPAKDNNFRYDGRNASGALDQNLSNDDLGLKCPFQSHIRKTNPRQNVGQGEHDDRGRSIVRRGIPYGDRNKEPNVFDSLEDLPTGGVGLLFACFQKSIVNQFAFMQKTWANNTTFKVPLGGKGPVPTGIDPLIGQPLEISQANKNIQNWRQEYGGDPGQAHPINAGDLDLSLSHTTPYLVSNFIRFRGGEFFFAPSMPFLLNA